MALTEQKLKDIDDKIQAVESVHSGEKSRSHRRNLLVYGGMALLYLVLIVILLANQGWTGALSILGAMIWLGLVWFQAYLIVEQRFVISMMQSLHELEREEVAKTFEDDMAKFLAKTKKKATT